MVTPLAAVRDRLETAGIPDAAFEAAQLYMLATGRDARLSGGAPLTAFEQKKLDALCEKRCARFPLQYLCGEWDFLDLTLKVGPGVLIPRADTETVAEAAVEAAREAGPGAAVRYRKRAAARLWGAAARKTASRGDSSFTSGDYEGLDGGEQKMFRAPREKREGSPSEPSRKRAGVRPLSKAARRRARCHRA